MARGQQVDATAYITAPMFTDVPFSQKMPMPPQVPCCMRCCVPMPKVRGIPTGSRPFDDGEKADMLQKLDGNWKIVPLQAGGNVAFTDAMVRNEQMILTGGMTNRRGGRNTGTRAVANQTQVQGFHFFRGPDGSVYTDFLGTVITKLDVEGGEVEFDNALGMKLLFQRPWKQMGLAAPSQQVMSGAEATVVGNAQI